MNYVCEAQRTCFSDAKQLLRWVLESLNAHISNCLFSQNGAFVWLAWVVPGLLGAFFECFWVFLSVFECFWVFLSVFECFWVPKTQFWAIWKGLPKGFGQKTRFLVIFWPKNMVPNRSRDHCWTLTLLWSMNDVYEAPKMCFSDAKNSFYNGFWNL